MKGRPFSSLVTWAGGMRNQYCNDRGGELEYRIGHVPFDMSRSIKKSQRNGNAMLDGDKATRTHGHVELPALLGAITHAGERVYNK